MKGTVRAVVENSGMLAGGGCPLRALLGCGPPAWKERTRHHQSFLSPLVGTLLKYPRLKKANLILEELLCRCFVAFCLLPCSGENMPTSFAPSSGLDPGICHLRVSYHLRLSPSRGPRLGPRKGPGLRLHHVATRPASGMPAPKPAG